MIIGKSMYYVCSDWSIYLIKASTVSNIKQKHIWERRAIHIFYPKMSPTDYMHWMESSCLTLGSKSQAGLFDETVREIYSFSSESKRISSLKEERKARALELWNKECVVDTSGNRDEAVTEVGVMSSDTQLPYSDLYTCQTTPVRAVLRQTVMSDSATPWTVAHQAPLSMGILWARILEWVAMPSSRGSSKPRDWSQVSITIHFLVAFSKLSWSESLSWNPKIVSEMQRLKDSGGKFFRTKVYYWCGE